MTATFKGYCIVGPVGPWDEEYRDAIELDHARQTIANTPGDAWRKQCRTGVNDFELGELSHRIQLWHDRGYRLREVELKLIKDTDNDDE